MSRAQTELWFVRSGEWEGRSPYWLHNGSPRDLEMNDHFAQSASENILYYVSSSADVESISERDYGK